MPRGSGPSDQSPKRQRGGLLANGTASNRAFWYIRRMNARPNDPKPRPALIKKLTRHGNSLALVIDKPILDLLGIDADTELTITTDGQRLFIDRPATRIDPARLQQVLEQVDDLYGPTLQKLAQ